MNKILFEKVKELKEQHGSVSVVMLMRKFKITQDKAQEIIKKLL